MPVEDGGRAPLRGPVVALPLGGLAFDLDVLVEFVEVDLLVASLERHLDLAAVTTAVLSVTLLHAATLRVGHYVP